MTRGRSLRSAARCAVLRNFAMLWRPQDTHRFSPPMEIYQLHTVNGFIAFEFDDARVSAGGTRYAPDVSEREAQVLARAMTYKFAVLGRRNGGAKGAVRGA